MGNKSRTLSLKHRGMNFEMLMWIFTRLSALAMYFFVTVGLIGALWMGARNHMNFAEVMRWAFTPNVTHVQNTDIPAIDPWASVFWRGVASLLVFTAIAHGVHGVVVICDDYIISSGGRQFVRLLSMIAMASMAVISLYVIWTS